MLFVVINLAFLAWSGIKIGGDTEIYTDGANALLQGEALTVRQPSYFGYIAVVAFFQKIGTGLTGLVIGQVAAATLAALAVYKMAVELGGRTAGALAVLLLALDIDTNRWHAYVLADSLYMSVLTLAVWLVYRASPPAFAKASAGKQALKPYLSASLALLAAGLIRPEGWFVIPAAAIYWAVRGDGRSPGRAARLAMATAACALLVAVIAPRLTGNVEAVGPGEMLRRGQTIWEYDGWRVPMPAAPSVPGGNTATDAIGYAVAHPIGTVALMTARVAVHVAHVRPFYSFAHNAAIVLWLLPVYVFGGWGLWALRRHSLARWSVAVIGTQALVVGLTHADWDGRYLSHVLPIVYPFVACGLVPALDRMTPGLMARLARG